MKIKELVLAKLDEEGLPQFKLAAKLGISPAMLSSYINHGFNPSLEVARKIYELYGEVMYPFSEEAVSND